MFVQIFKAIKIPLILLLGVFLSLILTNLGDEKTFFDQFFFGSQNRLKEIIQAQDPVQILINNEAPKLSGRWAIAVKNLETGQIALYNASELFPAASLYKLAVMWTTFDALEKGKLQKTEVVSGDKFTLDQILAGKQNIPTETPQSSPFPPPEPEIVSSTVEDALSSMITISDNYSAILLAERLGWVNIDKQMEKEGIADIDLTGGNAPEITAAATLKILESIYSNKAVSYQASEEMKKLLFSQKINDRIPKYLPSDVKVGHKTGELGDLRHDAGIVLGKNSDYLFVFLSQTPQPNEAVENIAELSKRIFDLLEME